MTKEEAIEILEIAKSSYPNMRTSEKAVYIWIEQLMKMDYKPVKAKLMNHIMTSKYPPTIAEIAVNREKVNEHKDDIDKWRQEAMQVPTEVRQEVNKKMADLVRKLGGNK